MSIMSVAKEEAVPLLNLKKIQKITKKIHNYQKKKNTIIKSTN